MNISDAGPCLWPYGIGNVGFVRYRFSVVVDHVLPVVVVVDGVDPPARGLQVLFGSVVIWAALLSCSAVVHYCHCLALYGTAVWCECADCKTGSFDMHAASIPYPSPDVYNTHSHMITVWNRPCMTVCNYYLGNGAVK